MAFLWNWIVLLSLTNRIDEFFVIVPVVQGIRICGMMSMVWVGNTLIVFNIHLDY